MPEYKAIGTALVEQYDAPHGTVALTMYTSSDYIIWARDFDSALQIMDDAIRNNVKPTEALEGLN